jgi:hypothetical protein
MRFLYGTQGSVSAMFMDTHDGQAVPANQCCGAASFLCGSGSGKNFDEAQAPAPTLLDSKAKFLKRTKV